MGEEVVNVMGDFWTVIVEAFHAVTQQIGWFAGELISSSGSLHAFLPVVATSSSSTICLARVLGFLRSTNRELPLR